MDYGRIATDVARQMTANYIDVVKALELVRIKGMDITETDAGVLDKRTAIAAIKKDHLASAEILSDGSIHFQVSGGGFWRFAARG